MSTPTLGRLRVYINMLTLRQLLWTLAISCCVILHLMRNRVLPAINKQHLAAALGSSRWAASHHGRCNRDNLRSISQDKEEHEPDGLQLTGGISLPRPFCRGCRV